MRSNRWLTVLAECVQRKGMSEVKIFGQKKNRHFVHIEPTTISGLKIDINKSACQNNKYGGLSF
jgi:hypothetical protein